MKMILGYVHGAKASIKLSRQVGLGRLRTMGRSKLLPSCNRGTPYTKWKRW